MMIILLIILRRPPPLARMRPKVCAARRCATQRAVSHFILVAPRAVPIGICRVLAKARLVRTLCVAISRSPSENKIVAW